MCADKSVISGNGAGDEVSVLFLVIASAFGILGAPCGYQVGAKPCIIRDAQHMHLLRNRHPSALLAMPSHDLGETGMIPGGCSPRFKTRFQETSAKSDFKSLDGPRAAVK